MATWIEETGSNSWLQMRVRKNGREGTVVKDMNGHERVLTVKMDDGTEETIIMNNVGPDPRETQQWEFKPKARESNWLQF